MEKRGISLAEIQEVPKESMLLLTGPPGTPPPGKKLR